MRLTRPHVALTAVLLSLSLSQTAFGSSKGPYVPPPATNASAVIGGSGTSGPLTIFAGDDFAYQVKHGTYPGNGQFFPTNAATTADCGILVRTGGVLYAPGSFSSFTNGKGAYTAWTGSISAVGNTATVTSTTIPGLKLEVTNTYTPGQQYFQQKLKFTNTSASAKSFNAYLAGDIYVADDDNGVPIQANAPLPDAVGAENCAPNQGTYKVCMVPITPADRWTARTYNSLWAQIGGGDLDKVRDNACEDAGAGLEWKIVNLPAGQVCVIQAVTAFGDKSGIPLPTVGVNKDIKNNTGMLADDIEILIQGSFNPIAHYDGYSNHHFNTFQVIPQGANTRLRWSNPNASVPNGVIAHVGFTGYGNSVTILGVFWSASGGVIGCGKQISTGTHAWGTAKSKIKYKNTCDSCSTGSLYAGAASIEWHATEVPLADLNGQAVRNPIRIDTVTDPAVLLAPGAEGDVGIPFAPPPNARFALITHKVGTTPGLNTGDETVDYEQFVVPPPAVPGIGTWGIIALVLLLAMFGSLLLFKSRRSFA